MRLTENRQGWGKTDSQFDYGKSGINYLQNGVLKSSEWNEWVRARRRETLLDISKSQSRRP